MFQIKVENINSQCYKVRICDSNDLTFEEVIHYWINNKEFRSVYISFLKTISFPAYFWETPAITKSSLDKIFEFVVIDSPTLAKQSPTPQHFAQYFTAKQQIVSFCNLGKDTVLVVPCPENKKSNYTHLGSFSQNASLEQQHLLWQNVGQEILNNLNELPLWVNTSGLGVFWLHIRLDRRPKYYKYDEYKSF